MQFSLLFPKEQVEERTLNENTENDLSIDYLCDSLTSRKEEKMILQDRLVHLCSDAETIQYRSDIFDDFMKNDLFRNKVGVFIEKLQVLGEYSYNKCTDLESSSVWKLLNRLKELDLYVNCIEAMQDALKESTIHSEGLRKLKKIISQVYENSGFKSLKKDLSGLLDDLSRIKSLTLGVNLDADLRPVEVELVEFREKKYKPGDSFLKNFMKFAAGFGTLNATKSPAALKASSRIRVVGAAENDQIMGNLTKRVEVLLGTVVNDMRIGLKQYIDVSGYEFISLVPEFTFYLRFAEQIIRIKKKGVPFCKPELWPNESIQPNHFMESDNSHSSPGCIKIKELYNIKLAIHLENEQQPLSQIVKNDICFNETERVYLLTGPNRGGKTTFTQAVGLCVLLAQNGIYVPAKEMAYQPVDEIFTHFPADENKTVELGRLGEESVRLHDIIKNATSHSLILLNESLATTNFTEGLYIAKDVTKGFCYLNTKVIFNTHMHELAAAADEINNCGYPAKAVSIVMGIHGKERSYEVEKRPPMGNSYARDIARKYEITIEQITEMIEQENETKAE